MADINRSQGSAEVLRSLLMREEIAAERLIAWVRIVAAIAVGATYFLTVETLEWLGLVEPLARPQHTPASLLVVRLLALLFMFGTGILALVLARPGRWRGWMSYLLVVIDAAVLIFSIIRPLSRYDLPANVFLVSPSLFIVPVAFALGSLRPQPRVQMTFVVVLTLGLALGLAIDGYSFELPTAEELAATARFYNLQSNLIRVLLLIAAGVTVALGVARSRRLLFRMLAESERRKVLTRFLPAEIAPQITGRRSDLLRRGARRVITIMFVDIRDSTAMGETMDPMRLSVFISSFRRRVMRAAVNHHGVVDKFVGDGAMVLFGIDERQGAAAEAIACARDLLDYIARWNEKRAFAPPVRVGIGIHTGEAYVGVIGSEERLEFTVLGDAVNVAARLEDLTKRAGVPLLVSQATLAEAGCGEGWRLVADNPLRGRSGDLAYFADRPPADRLEGPAALRVAE